MSGAFIVGKSIGERPFSNNISNKTLEGVLGGIILAPIGGTSAMLMGWNL